MSKRNLIESWLAAALIPGMSVAQALRDLNEELGTRYAPQEFYKWRRGDKSVPGPVQDTMLRAAISHAVREALGVNTLLCTDKQLDRLAEMLSPPERRN